MYSEIKVSIITVCLNSAKTIEKTIKSVLEQTYPNIEYLVLDGVSTDGTLDVLKDYVSRFNGRMQYISEKDKGIYYAMNKGIDMASGDIVGIINSDDWYEKDAVQTVVDEYANGHNECTVYHGQLDSYKDDTLICSSKLVPEVLRTQGMAAHPTCFVTMETYRRYGSFDVKYRYVADYDLMLRLYDSKNVEFVDTGKHIANAKLGGLSASRAAYEDLLQLKVDRGMMTTHDRNVLVFKARVSEKIDCILGKRKDNE